LQEVFEGVYDRKADEWDEIFGPQAELSPDSLEEIEIEVRENYETLAAQGSGLLSQIERVAALRARLDFSGKDQRDGSLLVPRLPRLVKGGR